jgi:hypothetical protein
MYSRHGIGNARGAVALKVPTDVSSQRDDTIDYEDAWELFKYASAPAEAGVDLVPDLAVGSDTPWHYLDVILNHRDAVDSLGGVLGFKPFEASFDAAGKGHDSIGYIHLNVAGFDVRLPQQLAPDIVTDAIALRFGSGMQGK